MKAVKNVPLSGFMLEDDFALKLFRECASLLETKLKNRVKAVKIVPSIALLLCLKMIFPSSYFVSVRC